MRIIGIDPGSRKTGFGVIDLSPGSRRYTHVEHGVLRLDVDRSLAERMRELAERLTALFARLAPTHCAIEDVFVSEGLRSALILGQARGAVLATCGLSQIPVQAVTTTQVKLAVAGLGRASKHQVGQMVTLLLKLDKKPAEDAADALATAMCHAHLLQTPLPEKAQHLASMGKKSGKGVRQSLMQLAIAQGKL